MKRTLNRLKMRGLPLIILYILSGTLVFARQKTTVNIKIDNYSGPVFLIRKNVLLREEQTIASAGRAGKSKYLFELKSEEEKGKLYLDFGSHRLPIFLEDSGNLNMYFDAKDIYTTLKFTGKSAQINKYFLKKDSIMRKMLPSDLRQKYSLPYDTFNELNDKCFRELSDLIHIQSARHKFPKKIQKIETFDNYSKWAINKYLYPDYHSYFTGKKFDIPEDYHDFMTKIPLDDGIALRSESYVDMVSFYLDYQIRKLPKKDLPGVKEQQISAIEAEISQVQGFPDNEIKSFFIGKSLLSLLDLGFVPEFEQAILKYGKIPYSSYMDTVIKRFNAFKSLSKGKPGLNFTFESLDNNLYDLARFKGKIVFIDIWSAACHGSLEEWPYLADVQNKLKDNSGVVFIHLNLDKSKRSIDEKNNGKVTSSVFWGFTKEPEFEKNYHVNNVPRYIIIDKDGLIEDAFAARPSSTDLYKVLYDLSVK